MIEAQDQRRDAFLGSNSEAVRQDGSFGVAEAGPILRREAGGWSSVLVTAIQRSLLVLAVLLALLPLGCCADAADFSDEAVATKVRELATAFAKYDNAQKEELRADLAAGGDTVLASLLRQREVLLTDTNRLAGESVIANLPGREATRVTLQLLLDRAGRAEENELANRFFPPRSPGIEVELSRGDWERILGRIRSAEIDAYGFATIALWIKGPKPEAELADAICELFVKQVRKPLPRDPGISIGYMSGEAIRLTSYRMKLEEMDRDGMVARLKAALTRAESPREALWLKVALGHLGESSVMGDLLAVVEVRSQDLSHRAVSLRAYAIVAGEAARPVLERYLTDTNRVVAYPIPKPALWVVAHDALARLNFKAGATGDTVLPGPR